MRPWRRLGSERLCRCRVFDVDRLRLEPPGGGPERDFFVIAAPDWVHVVPLTPDRRVIFVRQYRFGIEEFTLEVPAGMCDAGEDPADAARRELLEETGYEAAEMAPLGWVHPNPALQANRCHSFLARDVRLRGAPRPDPDEELEVTTVPLAEVPRLIAEGAITHSLVVATFHLLSLKEPF